MGAGHFTPRMSSSSIIDCADRRDRRRARRGLLRLALGASLARGVGARGSRAFVGPGVGSGVGAGVGVGVASAARAQAPSEGAARASARVPPGTTKLVYEVFLDDYRSGSRVATMDQQFDLLPDGDYRFRSEAQATGLLSLIWRGSMLQVSRGGFDANGLRPFEFIDRRGNRKARGAKIDRASGQATFFDGHKAAAPEGTQDRLSVLAQLGLLLAAGDGAGGLLVAGHTFEFPMLATSRITQSQWRFEEREKLRFESGAVDVIRIRRLVPPGEDSPSIVGWFDPARLPWPVRIRVAEADGQALDQVLQRVD